MAVPICVDCRSARFLERRDGSPANPKPMVTGPTAGAADGVRSLERPESRPMREDQQCAILGVRDSQSSEDTQMLLEIRYIHPIFNVKEVQFHSLFEVAWVWVQHFA